MATKAIDTLAKSAPNAEAWTPEPCPLDLSWTALLARHALAYGRRQDVLRALPLAFRSTGWIWETTGRLSSRPFLEEQVLTLDPTRGRLDAVYGVETNSVGVDGRGPWFLTGSGVTTRAYRAEVQDVTLRPWLWRRDYLSGGTWSSAKCGALGARHVAWASIEDERDGFPAVVLDLATAEVVAFGCATASGGRYLEYVEWSEADEHGVRWPHLRGMTMRIEPAACATGPADCLDAPPSPVGATFREPLVRVPIRVDGLVHFEVQANGAACTASFDSGSSVTTVRAGSRLAQTLGQTGASRVWGPSAHGEYEPRARLSELTIGGLSFRDVPVSILSEQASPDDMVVGTVLLETSVVRIDYAHHELSLAKDAAPLRGSLRGVDIALVQGVPMVRGTIDGHVGALTIDTGCDAALVLDRAWEGLPRAPLPVGGSPESLHVENASMGDVPLGALDAPLIDWGRAPSGGEAGSFGNPTLARCGVVVVDLPARKLWVGDSCGPR
jgi:hypothetical protein